MKVLVINQFADNKGDRAVLAVILDQLAAAGGVDSVTVATSRTGAWSAEDFKHCNLTVSLVPWGWPRPAGNTLMRRLQYRVMRQIAYPLARTTLAAPRALALDKAILGSLCNRSFLNAVRDADLIISTGGHHFTNWFSREGVSPLFFDLALAEIFGRRVVLWSQTIGALAFADPENQQFVNLLMCKADGIYVRDDGSLAELEQAGVDAAKVHKTHETVFGAETGAWSPPAEREPVVGISIYTGSQRTVAAINAYVAALSGLVNHICGKGYRVRFFPMQLKGQKGDDRDMIGQIVELSESDGQIEVLEEDIPAALHLQQVKECQLFVGHKTHSIIFALVTGTPVLAISYHQKTSDFMTRYNLAAHCVLEQDVSIERLRTVFDNIELKLDQTGETQWQQSGKQRVEMTEDFRRMLQE